MKKYLSIVLAAVMASLAFVGCNSLPTEDTMESTAKTVGYAAGMISNTVKIEDADRCVVTSIIAKVSAVVPSTNQNFQAAWTPVANEHLAKLVSDGRITAEKSQLIGKAFNVACVGIDYLFSVRYPKAKQYNDLIAAAVRGFNSGFLTTFKVNSKAVSAAPADYDREAFEYINSKIK